MEASSGPSILSFLNEDLLIRIYHHHDHGGDTKSFRATCKAFLRVDSLCRTHLKVHRLEFLFRLLAGFPAVNSLDLSGCPRFDDGAAAAIFRGGSAPVWAQRLRRVVLKRSCGLGYYGLGILVSACPMLVDVDVSYCSAFGDLEAAAVSRAVGLRSLRLDKCLGVTDVGLAKIAVGCQNLESISLKWCFEISDLGIDLLSKKCSSLRLLDISYLKVTNEALRARMERLEALTMVGCGTVDDDGMRYLGSSFPLLRVLDISRCERLGLSSVLSVIQEHNGLLELHASYFFFELHMTSFSFLKDLRHLKTLVVDGAYFAEYSFQIISTACTFLAEIGLRKCKGVTDAGILQLVSGPNNLKVIDLTCCSDITDIAIEGIAESCPNLRCLKLECCNMLTEKSLGSLGSFSCLLEELDLTDCSGVNDAGLSYLSKCSRLVCLKLGLCSNISDKGLSYIASYCQQIHELDLYWCSEVGDDGLAALSIGCKRLKKLNLSYCNKVTNSGMRYLGSMEVLSDLEMRYLLNVTGEGLAKLAAGCKELSQLDLKHCENIDDMGFWATLNTVRILMIWGFGLLPTTQRICSRHWTVHGDGKFDAASRCEVGESHECLNKWFGACPQGMLYSAEKGQVTCFP